MYPSMQTLRHPQQYLYQIRRVTEKKKSNQVAQKNSPCSALGYYSGTGVRRHVRGHMAFNSGRTASSQTQVYLSS